MSVYISIEKKKHTHTREPNRRNIQGICYGAKKATTKKRSDAEHISSLNNKTHNASHMREYKMLSIELDRDLVCMVYFFMFDM